MAAKKRSNLKAIVIVVLIAVILITGGSFVYLTGLGPVDRNNEETISVLIPEGSGGSYIVEILDEHGLSPRYIYRITDENRYERVRV